MAKKIISMMVALSLVVGMFTTFFVSAAVESEDEIAEHISEIKSVYKPGETYFVSNSTSKWVGEDNINGDKTQECFAPGTTNSHGRFGGLWQSMGFANYVFYSIFGEMPKIGYHCNPADLNSAVEVIGRYATKCRHIRGDVDGEVTNENIKALLSEAKAGDILVLAPKKNCNMTGTAMIITYINETFITVYQADYKGKCAVTEDVISYDALAGFHAVTLLRSVNYPYPLPVAPDAVADVTLSGTDFSLNENVSIAWSVVKNTDVYKVYLLDEADMAVQQSEVRGTVASFVFKSPGVYRIMVVASNQYGDSEAFYSDEIVVHNQNIVTFRDYNGFAITTQKVEYGKNAIAPNVPQRHGYQFAGWDKSLENITEPTDITATYEVEKYTVRYYDVGGKKVLRSETVEYKGKANPPTNYTIQNGYVFAGWQISYDSEGTNYNSVDGDMTLIATEKWANLNLPIVIEASNVVRTADGTKYTATLNIKNHDLTESRNVKILGSLKASDGKALKIVVLYELALAAGESVTRNVEIIYSEKATTMEFLAVGMVGNSKTGGAFSKITSEKILDDTSWGQWSEWTTEDLISSFDAYETKTQYRYRDKMYTTATTGTLSGWQNYDVTFDVGDWSAWSNSYVSAFETESQRREVESRYIAPTYKTQYHYYHYCKGKGSIWTHASSGGTFHDLWVDSQLPYYDYLGGMNWYKGAACSTRSCPYWFVCDGSTYGGPGPWTRQVKTGGDYYQYRYRDTYYTYHFWKFGDWSTWSDIYKSGDDTETRTLYRYRNRSESGEAEDLSGNFYHVSGKINGVTTDFTGMTATVMVYKRCNTDPTEEQLEYVGQTTIGEGNTYFFDFKPKEMPSSETGEFIVALGIEGADRLVNLDVINAPVPMYKVKFEADGVIIDDPRAHEYTDEDGNHLKAQFVDEGGTARAPEPPVKEGHTFVKWSETLTGIKSDKTIIAEYIPNEYTLVFIDWENNSVFTQRLKYGDTILYPTLQPVAGATNRAWDKQLEGVEFVSDNMIICSVAELDEYTVTFMMDDEVISSQTVKHGQKAVLPEQIPSIDGMIFAGWVGTCSYEYITQDSIFKPSFMYSKTVSAPEAVMTKNSDGSSTVELSCETDGAEIYYIIEHCCGDASLMEEELVGGIWEESFELMEEATVEELDGFKAIATPYTGEITLQSDESVVFVAFADGMNESIPVQETNKSQEFYVDISIESNDVQEYRDSIKGDAVFTFTNNSPEYSIGTFTLCFYDQRGVLLDLIPQNVDITPGVNTVEFNDICIEGVDYSKSKKIECKLMTWLSGETVTPISDVVYLSIE